MTEPVAPHLARASVAGQAVDLLLFGAAIAGLAREALVHDVGLPREFLEPPSPERGRVPAPIVLRLWAELASRTGREHFGLWLAELLVGGHGETLGGHVVRSAPTLGEGLRRMIAIERVFHGTEILSLERAGDVARIAHRAPIGVGAGAGPAVDFGFAWVLRIGSATTGRELRATRARLMRPRPRDVGPWRAALGVEPRFDQPIDELELPAEALDLPQRTADQLVARLVEQHARALLEALPPAADEGAAEAGLAAAARAFVGRCIGRSRPEDLHLAAFARSVGASRRTVQRRLGRAGATFAGIVDTARADLARHHLRRGAAIAEVALALGFSDQAAFHKAFLRWEGSTPGAFARAARATR